MTGDEANRPSSTHLSVHVGTDWRVLCHTYPDRPPILSLDINRAALTLAAADGAVTPDHLRFARNLLAAVNTYVLDCERIHLAEQGAGNPPEENAA
ncbi:conserved hypothetical protein [Parafrankia sp. Ea1.12]|uniref:hypothetical protein n=1 Tax=Parafrankia sp. Ea1.12 TaxID=573499 RepID=UPI000DA570E2|nr:hypothetical protein [Parafrankia sp. Ea1.12]SQD94585.1 conserved hypothetical protein [Parafrankia sp. Ea1.12]